MNVYIWRRDDYSAMRGPCPEGFHIPSKEWWEGVIQILTRTFGMEINGPTLGTYLKMPMAGSRSRFTSEVSGVGTSGDYWSCTPGSSSPLFGVEFWFEAETSAILPMREFGRAFGYSLRWFKDSPVVPTSSWTTLYDWGNGAWIFRSSAEWLISISGNWLTRCTIQDKNLWATTVYNQWDTLTDANCWKFYQWGNNYGFAHSWAVTTSTTQVDASWYWPKNYYSSSTFIMNNNDWSSVQNDDLRWYVTWIQAVGHPIKNAYIGEYVAPREPWANTLAYRPFEEDMKDYSWNGRDWSIATGSVSYANNMITVTNWTLRYWANIITWTWDFTILWYRKNMTNLGLQIWNDTSRRPRGWMGADGCSIWDNGTWYRCSIAEVDNTLLLWTMVRKNNSIYYYENWVLKASNTSVPSINITWWNWVQLGGYGSGSTLQTTWTVGNLIIENTARTTNDILDYHNRTKAKYGL